MITIQAIGRGYVECERTYDIGGYSPLFVDAFLYATMPEWADTVRVLSEDGELLHQEPIDNR